MTVQQGSGGTGIAGGLTTSWSTDLRQLHYRFRTDAGTADGTPSWGATEDISYYPDSTNFRLRVQLRNAANVVSQPWQLYLSKNGGTYAAVTTALNNGVQSVDAGSSPDDTTILIPRLYPFESTADWVLSGASIDLDFAGNRIYPWSAAFTDFLSISRASNGYAQDSKGMLISFASNQSRITDLGLLIEDARTNLCLASQTFDDATSWGLNNISSIVPDAIDAPDGTRTADKIIVTGAAASDPFGTGSNTFSSGTSSFVFSAYLKAGSGNPWTVVNVGDGIGGNVGKFFNLSTGSIGGSFVGGDGVVDGATIEALANGWYRCIVTGHFTVAAPTAFAIIYCCCTADGNRATTTGDFQYCWGAQIEAASSCSSYIPTTTTSASRAADSMTAIGNLKTILIGAQQSCVIDCKTQITGTVPIVGDTGSGRILLLPGGGGETQVAMGASNPICDFPSGFGFSTGVKVGYALNDTVAQSVCGAGATVGTATSATSDLPTFGEPQLGGGNSTYGFYLFRRASFWNSKISDASLKTFTYP